MKWYMVNDQMVNDLFFMFMSLSALLYTRRVVEFGDKNHLGVYSQVGFSTEVRKKHRF